MFRQQGIVLHIYDMLHNLCFIFQKNSVYFIILSYIVEIILTFSKNHALNFKYQPGHLRVNPITSL
jgi:hypothetical protein